MENQNSPELDLLTTLKKTAVTAAQIGIGVAASKATGALSGAGVTVPVEALAVLFGSVVRGLCNILKTKCPRFFSWL